MIDRRGPARSFASVALAVLLTVLSLVVPLLDRGVGGGGLAVAEATQPVGHVPHDHRICLQHGAAAWIAALGVEVPRPGSIDVDPGPAPRAARPESQLVTTHHSRAPPQG